MLTILMTTNTPANDFSKRYREFIETVLKYTEDDVEVIFLCKKDYPDKDSFRLLASKLPNHQFVVLDERNNQNEVILVGLAQAKGEDILLCTWDTNLIVIEQLLQKRKNGCDLVFVKSKKSAFAKFFEGLGVAAYNFGTRLIKHNYDMFAETEVQLIDGRIANLICSAPDESFELRVTNNYKQLKQGIVENEKVFETDKPKKSSPVYPLGIVSFFYLLGLLALIIVPPIFNNGVYTWWSLIILAVWLILGIIGITSVTKHIYKARNADPVRLNRSGEPILIIEEYVAYNQDKPIVYNSEFENEVEKLFAQEQKPSAASLIRRSEKLQTSQKPQKLKQKEQTSKTRKTATNNKNSSQKVKAKATASTKATGKNSASKKQETKQPSVTKKLEKKAKTQNKTNAKAQTKQKAASPAVKKEGVKKSATKKVVEKPKSASKKSTKAVEKSTAKKSNKSTLKSESSKSKTTKTATKKSGTKNSK